ncbi:MAG: hypothetical protein JEY71_01860 [Sphaerochaeta sp.]|nr:hypothetical protein [Sphaerochaeta sp.]
MGFELLLPVVLFILTLIIIFLLRSDDKRNQRVDLIRKRSQALLKNIENSQTQFNELVQKVEERISKKIDESHLLISHVDLQFADLEARSEDLATLQKVLVTYQTSLTQLESITSQVEKKVVVVKAEVANLSRVQESFSAFDLRFEQFKDALGEQFSEGEENLRIQHLRVKEMHSASFARLQEYEKEVQQAEQDNLALIAEHTETLKNRQEASLNLVSVQAAKLRQLSEEGDQQMLGHEKGLQVAYRQASEKMQEQQREFARLQATYADQQKRQEEELLAIEEKALGRITEEMQSFVQQSNNEMSRIFEMTLQKTDISFQNMIMVVSEYLKELSLRLGQARAVSKLLGASEHASLLSFKEELNTLLQETIKGEQTLEALQSMEERASSSLALMHQQSNQLQESLASLRKEKLAFLKKSETEGSPRSVVFAMALVDEVCKPLEKESAVVDEPFVEVESIVPAEEIPLDTLDEENLPSVVFDMALCEDPEGIKRDAEEGVPVKEKENSALELTFGSNGLPVS